MLPTIQANMVSRMRTDAPQVSEELRAYVRMEYNGDGAAVIAAVQRAQREARARASERTVRTVLGALAKIPEALAAALTAPGGA